MISDYKRFPDTMKEYGERDTKGVEHARWRDVNPKYDKWRKVFCYHTKPLEQGSK